jgi:hypothetical protein
MRNTLVWLRALREKRKLNINDLPLSVAALLLGARCAKIECQTLIITAQGLDLTDPDFVSMFLGADRTLH